MKQHLGRQLKAARNDKGLSRSELGQLVGLQKKTIEKIETGTRQMKADELLTFTAIFGDDFEVASDDYLSSLIADLAARLCTFLDSTSFEPVDFHKKDWLDSVLDRLDRSYGAA